MRTCWNSCLAAFAQAEGPKDLQDSAKGLTRFPSNPITIRVPTDLKERSCHEREPDRLSEDWTKVSGFPEG